LLLVGKKQEKGGASGAALFFLSTAPGKNCTASGINCRVNGR
jgi:hypothetical protein